MSESDKSQRRPVCRFFNTKQGCRAGDQCRFLHPTQSSSEAAAGSQAAKISAEEPTTAKPAATVAARVVSRPTPTAQTQDPRAFQIGQITRRFRPDVTQEVDGMKMVFKMVPSDPDFPFEIDALECALTVPATYPTSAKASLRVLNKDIPRGFQLNIERGFDTISTNAPRATLLSLMNQLDKRLETLLAGDKVETITIVTNRPKPADSVSREPRTTLSLQPDLKPPTEATTTAQDRSAAATKRKSDLRQLEARFSRIQGFLKSADGLTYTLPLDSPKRDEWPAALRTVRLARLTVAEDYPLLPLELHLDNDSPEAKSLRQAFRERSRADPKATITQHYNYLNQHVKEMSRPEYKPPDPEPSTTVPVNVDGPTSIKTVSPPQQETEDDGPSHIIHIARPPEWDHVASGDTSSSEGDEGTDSDTSLDDIDEADEAQPAESILSNAPAERGILLSLPQLELHGIELLQLTSLGLTVKCERCKDTMDVERLRSVGENDPMRLMACKKCALNLGVRFRADLIHTNSVRAGYLDLDGCMVVDMLPSSFVPTCSECSTAYPAPGIVAVRGDAALAICRECHKKMTTRIVEVKFLQVSASAVRASEAPRRKKPKENLGVTVGSELPRRGRCQHYAKSYRWFRFSCCSKVFPCDRCHDEQTDHPNEHANRMLCGFCSREQNYRPDDCGICHAGLTGKKGSGFWEGGKGTRDPARMSRKDPRKFRGRNKTKSIKG